MTAEEIRNIRGIMSDQLTDAPENRKDGITQATIAIIAIEIAAQLAELNERLRDQGFRLTVTVIHP